MVKVKIIDATQEPLKVLAKATLTSYWDEWSIDNLDKITEKDAEMHIPKVLNYGHESILEHLKITWAVEDVSIVTLKQITRHRLMSFTVRSQRYIAESCGKEVEQVFHASNGVKTPAKVKVKIDDCDPLELFVIPKSVEKAKVLDGEIIKTPFGDDDLEVVVEEDLGREVKDFLRKSYELYQKLIKNGVPPEDARFVLPQAIKTKFTVTMNLREFKHFAGLRMCARAQWEIRELAWKMWESLWNLGDDWKKLLVWSKVAPRCIQLGYCPERELMPEGCWKRQKDWWNTINNQI